jgi:hypothetical protein
MAGTHSGTTFVIGFCSGYVRATVTAALNAFEFVVPVWCRIGAVQVYAGTAGSGVGSTVVDLLRNGVSVWHSAGSKPTLAAASTGAFANLAPDSRVLKPGDLLTWQVLSVPSVAGHSRLTVTAALERTTNPRTVQST